jgi:8-oxo-dGTP diphosphatase
MLTVVAALIESDGKLLVCQRRRGSMFELLWEFPGGKAEPGENLRSALLRELEEELGVRAKVGRELHRQVYTYE